MSTERTLARGLYFEDMEVGWKARTPGRTVTEADIVEFAGLSGDYTPLHTDAEYARGTIFGERVAHGLLGLAIASGLATRLGFLEETVEAFTGLEWKFRAPIRIGDTIHVEIEVAQKRSGPEPARRGGAEGAMDPARPRAGCLEEGWPGLPPKWGIIPYLGETESCYKFYKDARAEYTE